MKTPPLQKEGMFFCWDGKTAAVACRRKETYHVISNITKDSRRSMLSGFPASCQTSQLSGNLS